MTKDRFEVAHRPQESRYVLIDQGPDGTDAQVIGEQSYLDFADGDRPQRIIYHTQVAKEHGGQGLGSTLVRAALDHLTGEGLDIVPVCPYVAAWLPKHPEYTDRVVQPTPAHIQLLRRGLGTV